MFKFFFNTTESYNSGQLLQNSSNNKLVFTRNVNCVFLRTEWILYTIPKNTIPNGHNPEWTQSRMDTIPNGHNPEWTQSRMDTIPNGHHPEWTPSRMDTIPNVHNPEWTPSRMDTIPNGHDPEWTRSRMSTYNYIAALLLWCFIAIAW